ncbi:F-box protein SKIP31-like isoform X2 [Olea europaea var. sylvestris]|uniref:F-box protein SKIP31-like isoform X2 n=1 Tax=Olea europaea var. sylvestris TaxID=158386 RepID=UPI000C1CE6BC|nr:F-box protein SKIP31-like isoform X2 [Olea europaea var. sylvestris]
MASDDDDDEVLAQFLESEVLAELSDEEELKTVEETVELEDDKADEEERDGKRLHVEEDLLSEEEEKKQQETKRIRVEEGEISEEGLSRALISSSSSSSSSLELGAEAVLLPPKNGIIKVNNTNNGWENRESRRVSRRIESGVCSKVPPELFHHILKFLSSEDLSACSLVCKFLSYAASDESLWRRLYCMRWGLLPPKKPRECAWKKLYIQRDEEDMAEFVRGCPSEFKEYYIQMQVAKRSQAPLPSQTLADQVSMWKSSRGLADTVVADHACSGESCTYYQIGDVFVCEKTGHVHVCDDTCREVIPDPMNELLVCVISGRCFDRLLSPAEMEPDAEQQQGGATDEAEPFMGSGRFARAYQLGYSCKDEQELEACLRFC